MTSDIPCILLLVCTTGLLLQFQNELFPLRPGEGMTSQKVTNHTNLMTCDVVVQTLMEIAETEVVLIEVVVVQFEFAVLSGNVPQWGPSGHSPLPAM